MRIPPFITIGGVEVPVRQVADEDIRGCLGEYDTSSGQIRLKKNQSDDLKAQTFMHEIAEAVANNNCLEISHDHLTVLVNGIFAAIRDNGLDFRREPL